MLVNGLPAARLGDATFDGGPIVQGSSTVLFNGRPASRQGDATLYGGPITSGSPNVLIGTPGGVADSCCIQQSSQTPATTPNPVHVQLGAKVLTGPEDMDFALPGALPLVWQRQYSSRVSAEHGAACGALGHGWHLLNEVTLQLKDESIEIFDAGGRVITFEQGQPPGGLQYSRSEDIYLFRGGKDDKGRLPNWSYQERFTQVPPELAGDENCILAASGSAEVLWVFNPAPEPPRAEAVEQAADKAKQASKAKAKAKATGDKAQVQEAIAADQAAKQAAPGQCWRLTAQIDRFGRSQRYEYSDGKTAQPVPGQRRTRKDAIPPAGRLMAITDGVGRRYRLTHQRIHNGHEAQYPWGADDGWRLVAVELERDPLYPLPETIMLVRYGYSRQGQLSTVHDRAGALVREFEWSRNRISGHRYRGGPWHRYRYEGQEPNVRVAAHTNEQGLDYSFEYQTDPPTPEGVARHTTIVTDSFKRVQTHHFEGEQGLERLFEHVRADGTVMQYKHDGFGRLYASTDPLGRSLYRQLDGNGNIKGTQQTPGNDQYPAGLLTRNQFDKAGRITESVDPAGAVTRYQYDGHQRLRTIEYPDGTAEHYRYPDPKEQPLICDNPSQIIDAKGGIKHLAYNPAGQLTRFTDCSGQSTHSEYDRWGEVIEIIDAQGNRTRHERDAAGRISATHMPNGQTRRYQYDSQGNLSRIEPDADTPAAALEITRDLWGRPARIEQGGLSVQIEYDKAGRLITLTNENGSKSRFVWDVMDRLVQETGFDGRVQRYRRDAAGQLIASKDGAGQEDDPVTQYCYDVFGRMTERLLSLSGGGHAQSQRLEFDALTRLKAASVYHLLIQQSGGPIEEHLQSRVEFERDGMGRITAEVQRLYREPAKPDQPPVIEYEHRIEHTLDQQGNRQQSQLQGLGGIDWLRYGSGHVHGLMHNRLSLIDFERDSLHRETKRTLHGLQGTGELTLTRSRDSLGRLSGIDLQGLKATNLPPILVGQITNRQYHYNPLSELIAIQMPDETLGFGYDAAGRLRAQARYDTREYMQALAGQAIPRSTRRWKIDPAGNRLPVKLAEENQQRQDWAAAVYENWKDPSFNLLQNDSATNTPNGMVEQWPDNRIGYSEELAWRYSQQGNRVEQLSLKQDSQGQYPRQRLAYDGANQLTAVEIAQVIGRGQVVSASQCQYIYDGLGRRLKKTFKDQDGKEHVTYFGWDGDQQVHTETVKDDGTRDIVHIIYAPGTFTPMVRLSTTVQGNPHAKPSLLARAAQSAWSIKPGDADMDSAMSSASKMMEQNVKNLLKGNLSPMSRTLMGNMGIDPDAMLAKLRQGLEQAKQADRTDVTVHYFLCDHLGTPLALTDQRGQMVWATKLDPWGNIEEEYNPQGIEQNIRLPGQYHDRETGLYYNRHRYYDPKIGSYVNQDPVGLIGGINQYSYVRGDPLDGIDPRGLCEIYGEWCGPNWTGGRVEEYSPYHDQPGYYANAIDILDEKCRNHDMCYYRCRRDSPCDKDGRSECFRACDRILRLEAYNIGGFWGHIIGAAMARPGTRDPGPDAVNCRRQNCQLFAPSNYLNSFSFYN